MRLVVTFFSLKGRYGGLNKMARLRLIGSGAIRRRGLFGGGVALLEQVCHWEWVLSSQKLKPGQCITVTFC